MSATVSHALIAPIALPLMTGAALLLLERRRPQWVAPISLAATAALAVLAALLVSRAADGGITVYLLGNWRAPFGIALALDRLSALMLALTALVALASVLYARAGDDRRGAHFHALFQFQLMGLNGAFLTADLFNLFVFFEVLLIASYGLLLHGAGAARLKAAIHYVSFNLTGSALFLIAVSALYAVTGTLNMADLAQRVPQLDAGSEQLVRAAALLLLVVFCVKAALLPLYFWLPDTYGAATAPVAALFAIMTKVGVYAVARMYTLVFGDGGGAAANVAQPWLPWLALATLLLGVGGALAAARLRTLVAYLVIASAGTLLLGLGLGRAATVAAVLFYLVNSTLVAALLFLLIDRIDAARGDAGDRLLPARFPHERSALGAAFFIAAVAVAGMPPLAGFLGKALLLQSVATTAHGPWVWTIVLLASFGVIVALMRAGSAVFWSVPDADAAAQPVAPARATPSNGAHAAPSNVAHTMPSNVASAAPSSVARAMPSNVTRAAPSNVAHAGAIGLLLAAIGALAVFAQPVAAYAAAAAQQLFERRAYIDAVLGAQPVPPAIPIRTIVGGKPKDAAKTGGKATEKGRT